MPYWNRQEAYTQDKAILKSVENVSTPLSLTVLKSSFGYNMAMKSEVPAGLFISRKVNAYRYLPRTSTSLIALAAQKVVRVTHAFLFVPGDVLLSYSLTDAAATTTALGTIASVNYVTREITLVANVAADLASGSGVMVAQDEIMGLTVKSANYSLANQMLVAPVTAAEAVYQESLPFYDANLKALVGTQLGIRKQSH
jgi:hypothetical protein